MTKKLYDVVKAERVEGREKPFYSNVGKIIQTDKGYVKLHIPLLGWLDCYVPKDDEQKDRAAAKAKAAVNSIPDDGDEIPF